MFLSTFEKQLDAKRRIVVPQDFRAAAPGPFDGVFCFPSIEADCLEGGGGDLLKTYDALIAELPFGDPLRAAIETSVRGGFARLAWAWRCTFMIASCATRNSANSISALTA